MAVHLERGIATAACEAHYVVLAVIYHDSGLIDGPRSLKPCFGDMKPISCDTDGMFRASLDAQRKVKVLMCGDIVRKQQMDLQENTVLHENSAAVGLRRGLVYMKLSLGSYNSNHCPLHFVLEI
ncbi:hypothetical protein EYF80_013486 [Liparis tanakae]|uniref:Uncharacterized protein n=1 Tax=Liparis tanakae TaxID=230148 RepID=A0A4Z2IDW3_9TELE|nr:hypothetical protein EYF80_013486 [Liparis tanakae]